MSTLDSSTLHKLSSTSLFDAEWYLRETGDLRGLSPLCHYLTVGWLEGRDPNPLFHGSWYLAENLDVAERGLNPLLHYIWRGELEGRWPCGIFDPVWYCEEYGVALGEGRALTHYSTIGCKRDLRPNEVFDPLFYRERYTSLREAGIEVPLHYLDVGFSGSEYVSTNFSLRLYREEHFGGDTSIDAAYHYLMAKRRQLKECDDVRSIASEMRIFTNQGPFFEEFAAETLESNSVRAKLVAFYLPQFHAIPENDSWWGKGFTEWRNTQRGVPRFVGHQQPRVPRDLGFYDLSNPNVLPRQIELARHAGLHGFCFYYYHFDGRRLLERPIEQFLSDRTLDFPFCIMWANENWTRRWDGLHDEVLIEQRYLPEHETTLLADWCRHFEDPRYIKVSGRPMLLIYRPGIIPQAAKTIRRWRRRLAQEFGQYPWMLMCQAFSDCDPRAFNLDGAVEFPPHKLAAGLPPINSQLIQLDPQFTGTVLSYEGMIGRSLSEAAPCFPLIKGLCPSWDNDCRRQGAGLTLHGSSPSRYRFWLERLVDHARAHPFQGEPFIFLNAWNEWAEGAHLEPDVYHGAAYLNATARALVAGDALPVKGDALSAVKLEVLLVGHDAHRHGAQLNLLHLGRILKRRFGLNVTWLLLEGGALIKRYREVGPTTIAQPGSAEFSQLLRALKSAGVHYAITNTLVTGGAVPELRHEGFRIVSLVHELPGLASEYNLEKQAKAIAESSHAVVCAAEMVARGFRDFAGQAQGTVHILPQGVYAELPRVPGTRESVRRELGLSAEAKIVLGVGFGDRRKGFDLFLKAARAAAKNDKKVTFVWVGDVLPNLSAEAANTPANYRQVGFTDAVGRYLHAADALFLSSREDPFPAVVLEALAYGLPVVGFAGCTGTEDLIREHGTVVPAFDIAAAAQALHKLMTLENSDAAVAADRRQQIVERDFNYGRYAFRLLQLLNPSWRPISVVVPNYNYAHYLTERMESIFAQSVPVFEIIVLDDCSTDESLAVLDRVRHKYGRDFSLVSNSTNSGSTVGQWLKGAEQASGELLWIAEADDLCESNFLQRLLLQFEGERTLFAFVDSAQIDSNGVRVGDSYHAYYAQSDAEDLSRGLTLNARIFAERFLAVRNLILNVSSILARRDDLIAALRKSCAQLQSYSFAGDWHVYATLCLREGDVTYVPEPLNIHRRHENSATHATTGAAHIAEIEKVHDYLEEAYGRDDELLLKRRRYIALLHRQFGLASNSEVPTQVLPNDPLARSSARLLADDAQ